MAGGTKKRTVRKTADPPPTSHQIKALKQEFLAQGGKVRKVPLGYTEGFPYKANVISTYPRAPKRGRYE